MGEHVRRAGEDDVEDLLRLRELMLVEMGTDVSGAAWKAAAREWLAGGLRRPGEFAAFVADVPGAGVVSCAIGHLEPRAPGPATPTGCGGRVLNLSTEPAHRRRGHARRCFEAVLAWFRTATPAEVIALNATGDGAELYRAHGFTAAAHPELRLPLPRNPRGLRPQSP